jgi:chromosome segregation ATPase
MEDLFDSIKGFFTLGGRDLVNRFKLLSYARQESRALRSIRDAYISIGRTAWEKGMIDASVFPVVEQVRKFDLVVSDKQRHISEIEEKLAAEREKTGEHTAHYQKRLREQLQLKKPVDDELNALLIEIKRMKREMRETQGEWDALQKKIDAQRRRREDFSKETIESNEYLRREVDAEIDLNIRAQTLKKEKVALLEANIETSAARAEKIRLVVTQYEQQIEDLHQSQRETQTKNREIVSGLMTQKSQLEQQISALENELAPVLEDLGRNLAMRQVGMVEMRVLYAQLHELERSRDEILAKRARRRKESDSIGIGIKAGFYTFLIGMLVLLVFLLTLLL